MIIVIGIKFGGKDALSDTEDDVIVDSIVDVSREYKVSEEGATLRAFVSAPNIAVENAKKYIIEKGYDDKELTFAFSNYRPNIYNPDNLIREGMTESNRTVYYVEEIYKRDEESPNICVGYFAINSNGVIIESNSLKNAEELLQYTIHPNIDSYAVIRAREILALDSSVGLIVTGCKCFFYEQPEGIVLCYKYMFMDGSEVYINGITGEKIK